MESEAAIGGRVVQGVIPGGVGRVEVADTGVRAGQVAGWPRQDRRDGGNINGLGK